jgi:hypothetical protein
MKVKHLWELGYLVRVWQLRMRFGELSRAPLRLLRIEVRDEEAECDWMARPADEWDNDLQPAIGKRNASLQALKDAMAIREVLFRALPEVHSAVFRVYRQPVREPPELIIAGTVHRGDEVSFSVRSPAMQAKLYGLHFWMDDGVLEVLKSEQEAVSIS